MTTQNHIINLNGLTKTAILDLHLQVGNINQDTYDNWKRMPKSRVIDRIQGRHPGAGVALASLRVTTQNHTVEAELLASQAYSRSTLDDVRTHTEFNLNLRRNMARLSNENDEITQEVRRLRSELISRNSMIAQRQTRINILTHNIQEIRRISRETPTANNVDIKAGDNILPSHVTDKLFDLEPHSCMICLEDLERDNIVITKCGHDYCQDCLGITLSLPEPKCGNCRAVFV